MGEVLSHVYIRVSFNDDSITETEFIMERWKGLFLDETMIIPSTTTPEIGGLYIYDDNAILAATTYTYKIRSFDGTKYSVVVSFDATTLDQG